MRRRASAVIAAALMVVLMAAPAGAVKTTVTSGRFAEYATGVGSYDIDGRAVMVRTGSGKTMVVVLVRGLDPGETYGSHVHKAACGSPDFADGHYRFETSGIPGAVDVDLSGQVRSEIWPGPFTANARGNALGWAMVNATAGPEAVSVVIHAPGGAKIACADLSRGG